jgi:hypothetical protein
VSTVTASGPMEQAARAARRGIAVFPLNGKLPLPGTRGFLDASSDPETVRAWVSRNPGGNYGIRTGQALPGGDYLAVLDIDPRNGGRASLAEWEHQHGPLPDTYTVATGGGGTHYYFTTSEPLACRTNVLPGVDLKADGGYVVGPGCIHPGDPKHDIPPGRRYEVERKAPIVPMPAALLELVRRTERAQSKRQNGTATGATTLSAELVQALARGKLAKLWEHGEHGGTDRSRSGCDAALAALLGTHGFEDADVEAALRAFPHGQVSETGDRRQIERLLGIAIEARARREATATAGTPEPPRPLVREIPPADPYPVAALGSLLSEAALAIQDRVQAPLAICAQSVLACATLAAQAHADVVLPTGARRPLSNFLLSVLETGGRKTAADNEAGDALRRRETELRTRYGPEHLAWRNQHDAWQAERRKILTTKNDNAAGRRGRLDALGPEPPAPLLPMLTCPEPTYEGLCKLLAVSLPSVGVFASEGAQFVGGHGMNPDNRLRTAAGLSHIWDGDPIRRVRAGDGASELPGRRVALHLMLQPGVASELLADPILADQGLLSRMLVTAPDSLAGTRLWREARAESTAALELYGARLLELLRAPLPLVGGIPNELSPRALPLSAGARRAWTEYADHIERQLAPDGALDTIRGLANKLPEHAARIAGVLTLVADLEAGAVTAERMEAGIELADHYAAEALRLYEVSRTDHRLRNADRLRLWLLHTWPEPLVSLPDIYQKGPNRIRSAADARPLVELIEQHGWLTRVEAGAEVAGVRRREAWAIQRPE